MNEERKNCQENFPITFSIRSIKKSYVTRNLYFTFEYEKIFTLIIFNMEFFLKETKKKRNSFRSRACIQLFGGIIIIIIIIIE